MLVGVGFIAVVGIGVAGISFVLYKTFPPFKKFFDILLDADK
jgi:hypothetical protein